MNATALVAGMDTATAAWHDAGEPLAADVVLTLHRANFDLWHLEDSARDPRATAQQIVDVKHSIDRTNQHRNDCVECLDSLLLDALAGKDLPRLDAPLHSETPGQMLDRLSILSLKRFHTAEESVRAGAGAAHQARNRDRLAVLETQSADLTACLATLWGQILAGERRFKLYRQMKMYNDADLNPVLYADAAAQQSSGFSSTTTPTRQLDPAQPLAYNG